MSDELTPEQARAYAASFVSALAAAVEPDAALRKALDEVDQLRKELSSLARKNSDNELHARSMHGYATKLAYQLKARDGACDTGSKGGQDELVEWKLKPGCEFTWLEWTAYRCMDGKWNLMRGSRVLTRRFGTQEEARRYAERLQSGEESES